MCLCYRIDATPAKIRLPRPLRRDRLPRFARNDESKRDAMTREKIYILSGAVMPIKCRVLASTIRAACTSFKRALVTASSSEMTRHCL